MVQISELFAGQQWEGREIGRTTIFVRFLECNMKPRCKWCDVLKYTGEERSLEKIVKQIREWKNINHVTFTGGEPSIHKGAMYHIMKELHEYEFALETNGLLFLNPNLFTTVAVSPKKQNINKQILSLYSGYPDVIFKPVVSSQSDYKMWKKLFDDLKVKRNSVYMMPEGTSANIIRLKTKQLAQKCIEDGFSLSPRVQYLLYGAKKGV